MMSTAFSLASGTVAFIDVFLKSFPGHNIDIGLLHHQGLPWNFTRPNGVIALLCEKICNNFVAA